MDTPEASSIFARAHDVHLLASGQDTAGFLVIDFTTPEPSSAPPSVSELRCCRGSTEFSTMCLLVSVSTGIDSIERGKSPESPVAESDTKMIRFCCDLLALSMTACSDDFVSVNEGFVAYVTLTANVHGRTDSEAAGYARERRRILTKFFASKFASTGDVSSIETLIKSCQDREKPETKREVISSGMDML